MHMKKTTLTISFFLAMSIGLLIGQDSVNINTIKGRVYQMTDNAPVHARVESYDNGRLIDSVWTDNEGKFELQKSSNNTLNLKVFRGIGYLEYLKVKIDDNTVEILVQDYIDKFYRLIHGLANIIITLILIFIWVHYYTKIIDERKENPDFGLLLIAAGLLIWGGISLLKHLGVNQYDPIFSPINNLFLLWSLPFFKHGFNWMRDKKNRTIWFVATGFVMASVTLVLAFLANSNEKLCRSIDFIFSAITLGMIGIALYRTFDKREFFVIGLISGFVVFSAIIGQFALVGENIDADWGMYDEAFFVVSYIIISALFIALGFSWLNEELNNFVPINLITFDDKSETLSVDKLKSDLAENKTEKVIKNILAFLNTRTSDTNSIKNELVVISSRVYSINSQQRLGTIKIEDYAHQRNQINDSILRFMDEFNILSIK